MTPDPYVIDGHNDLPWALRDRYANDHGEVDLAQVDLADGLPELQTDLPRLLGSVGGQFWSVFVPANLAGDAAVSATLQQIDLVKRMVAAHPDRLALATTADEVEAAVATGRVGSLLGIEGGHSIASSLGVLRSMHELGVRYMTLTHNDNLPWADSATDEPVLGGMSDFGRQVVAEMQRIGMVVDLSHVSDDVMHQALDVATAPVIFSHSSARALCDAPRNVPDDVLTRLPTNGGVCMIAFVGAFVKQEIADWYRDILDEVERKGGDRRNHVAVVPIVDERIATAPPPPCTAADVADHVEHVREVAGIAHVGLGSDYDGAFLFPTDMPDVTGYARLFEVLRARSWSERELGALAHGNALQALRDCEATARRHREPLR